MTSCYSLIPTDKGDIQTAERLMGHSYQEVRPVIGNLLEWLQDGHWPVAERVSEFLATMDEFLTADIVKILQSKDAEWKYQVLRRLVNGRPLAPEIRIELMRLVKAPSQKDIEEEVPELASELL